MARDNRREERPLTENDNWAEPDALLRIARLEGELAVLRERISAQDAADEHRRAELETARFDAASARVELAAAQARVEEWRRIVAEARERLARTEQRCERIEEERAELVAMLDRKRRGLRRS